VKQFRVNISCSKKIGVYLSWAGFLNPAACVQPLDHLSPKCSNGFILLNYDGDTPTVPHIDLFSHLLNHQV
jgi:hypothetical protein